VTNDVPPVLELARRLVESGETTRRSFRTAALAALGATLRDHRGAWEDALREDLGAPAFETWATQTGLVLAEIRHARRHLRRWMRPRQVGTPLAVMPSRSRIEPAPLGVVLVIAPWNYPLQLSLAPAVAAIAAGNAVVIKPSEHAPRTAGKLAELLPAALPPGLVQVVEGGPATARALLDQGFDHIFFTGSRRVGALVAEAAGRSLTPVTLELGGKCPALLDRSANLRLAARRLAWAKFLNAGQTCVAPDFVLVPEERFDEFAARLGENLDRFYGERPAESPDYGRIVNEAHFRRLEALLSGLPVLRGGDRAPERLYFGPTVTGRWPAGHPVQREEIFGPILPLIPYHDLDEALAEIRTHPDPLAFYVFSRRRRPIERAAAAIRSGALVTNDAVVQCANPSLPFGGVGRSGHGAYHGVHGFARLSYPRALLHAVTWLDPPVRYPPYRGKLGLLRLLLR
jgi:aldehyde dehydrogenase (NAD+)